MASNFFGLLEDVSSNDPVEIAKKRQHEAAVAKKNAEKKEQQEKQAQFQKEQQSSAKKADKKPVQKNTKPQQTRASESGDAVAEPAFERKDNRARGGRPSKTGGKHHVGPKTGREFDRHSGTGRGKEVAKNGGGSRNWGKPGAEVTEQTDKKRPFLKKPKQAVEKVEETPTTPVEEEKKEEEVAVENNAETTNAQVPEEEEEDKSITYDKLLAEKKKSKTSKPKPRKAGEGVAIDPSVMKGSKVEKKDESVEDFDLPIQGMTALKKDQAKKQKKQSADTRVGLGEFFKDDKDALEKLAEVQQYKPQSNKRGGSGRGRGGRGGSRGGNRSTRGSRPSNHAFNPSDFPALK